jgi:disease resistance protein RPM1
MDAYCSAQGAVESLLSSLALVLRDKPRLLGNVRGDVQCISDEMESMNGFLLDLNEVSVSEGDDHQVQAWKKQVRDVAVESERWVQQHHRWAGTDPRGGGLMGLLRRIQHLVLTVSERRDIATKIQELKARAHEVGERGQRYGIDVPSRDQHRLHGHPMADLGPGFETDEEEFARRLWLLNPVEPYITEEDNKNLISWLTEEGVDIPQVRVIQVVGISKLRRNSLMKVYYQDSVLSRFNVRLWITLQAGEHLRWYLQCQYMGNALQYA